MNLSHGPSYFCPLCPCYDSVYGGTLAASMWFVYTAWVTHSTWAELINSADPNANGEPHVATWKPGRCRVGKMKERSGPLILPKKVGMFVQIFSMRWHNMIPSSNMWSGCSAIGIAQLPTGKSSRQTRLSQMPADISASTAPNVSLLALCTKFWNPSACGRKCSLSASERPSAETNRYSPS